MSAETERIIDAGDALAEALGILLVSDPRTAVALNVAALLEAWREASQRVA